MEKIGRIIIGAGCILIIIFIIIQCVGIVLQGNWINSLAAVGFALLAIGLLTCLLAIATNFNS